HAELPHSGRHAHRCTVALGRGEEPPANREWLLAALRGAGSRHRGGRNGCEETSFQTRGDALHDHPRPGWSGPGFVNSMKLYRSKRGIIVERDPNDLRLLKVDWDEVINRPALAASARQKCPAPSARELLPPIGSQEVWAAGVTYYRSRDARMEE